MRSCNFTLVILALCLCCSVSRRYIYVKQQMTWFQAQQNCRQHYTDLVTFDNMTDIKSLKRPAGFGYAWIGLKDDPQTWTHLGQNNITSWRWSSTGETSLSTFESWDVGQPVTYFERTCVVMTDYGKWWDYACEIPLFSMCSNGTGENVTYIYVPIFMTWSAAQAYCRLYFTDLVTIDSSQVNSKISSTIHGVIVWIGLYRIPFSWSDGSQGTFRNWLPGAPSGFANTQFCAFETELHQWNDVACNNLLGSICYAPDLLVSTTTGLRMSLKVDTDITQQSMVQEIYSQFLKILAQNLTDEVKLQLKIEPKKLETKTSNQPMCPYYV